MTASREQRRHVSGHVAGYARTRLLDLPIDKIRLSELLEWVVTRAKQGTISTVLYVNVHCMNIAYRDRQYTDILNDADLVYCDGTGVKLAGALSGQRIPERMTGADWIWDLARTAGTEGLSLFLLGGDQGAAEEAAGVLSRRFSGLRISGTLSGYGVGPELIPRINASGADILLVGMGTPTQEKWIAAHRGEIRVPVVWAVGALFDFVSGRLPRGPHWLTNHGFEWACRLAAEPRKLWRRYLLGNPLFFWRVLTRHIFRKRARL